MNIITDAHREFLLSLLEADVSFIVIGGYAVIYHGYPRLTMDMDILLKPDNKNRKKLLTALHSYGIVKEDIERVKSFDFTQSQSFYIGEEVNKIDILTSIAGLTYEQMDTAKEFFKLDDKKVPIINYKHLVINKMLLGRSQDKADVDMLQKIRKAKGKE